MDLNFIRDLIKKPMQENTAVEFLEELNKKNENEVANNQEKKLQEFRKEEHLYMVEEDRQGRIFLTDITDESNNIVLEEIDFPKELVDQATEGTVFIYKDGTYHFHSRDGFERIYGDNN